MNYAPDGYSILKGTVKERHILALWSDLNFLVVKQLKRFSISPTIDMKENLELLLRKDRETYISTLALAARLRSSIELFSWVFYPGPHALHYPVLHIMAESLKIPGGYSGTASHQDWASTQGSLDTTTVWIPLTPTDNNFPLEVIPYSHENGLLDGKQIGSVTEVECQGDFIPINANFGDAVCMSSFLVHRTGSGGDGLRIAVSMRFENVNEPTFIERGYPCAQRRTVEREIKWKPTIEQVRGMHGLD